MAVYIISIISIIIFGLFIFSSKKIDLNKKKNIFLFGSFVVLFFIMGFRTENIGTDTKMYSFIFQKYANMSMREIMVSGDSAIIYALYNKIVSFFSTSTYAIIVANSLVICVLTMIFIKNNSKNVILSTIYFCTFYHFFNAMNISRQYIAIMLVANSLYFLREKNAKKFIIINVIATLIHNTAIISFIMLPWLFLKKNKRNLYIFLGILFIAALFFDKFLVIFSSLFTHYDLYFTNNLINDVGANKKVIITLIYVFISILLGMILKNEKIKNTEEYEEFYLYYLVNFVAIILGIVALKTMLITRIEMYFSIFAIIYIPKVYNKFKDKLIINIGFTMIMLIPMIIQLSNNNSGVLPYKNWLINIIFN